jgi:hypothetical protein
MLLSRPMILSRGQALMIRKSLDLPPAVARAFVDDVRAYFAEENPIKREGIAVRQLRALREHQGPREKKLRLSDVKEMFEQMKNHAKLAGPSRRGH